jgi:hypothetical protein
MIDCIVPFAGEMVPAMYQGKITDPRTGEERWLFVLLQTGSDGEQYPMPALVWRFELHTVKWLGSAPFEVR